MTIPKHTRNQWEFTRDRTYFPFLGDGETNREDAKALHVVQQLMILVGISRQVSGEQMNIQPDPPQNE